MKSILFLLSWVYLLCVVTLWAVMYFAGDLWWPATLILFGPRWMVLLPLVLLIPCAVLRQKSLLVPVLLGGGIAAVPFMGLEYPSKNNGFGADQPALRIVSCNVHDGAYQGEKLEIYIKEMRADVVALQECARQLGLSIPVGWHVIREGGLTILSRFPIRKGETRYAMLTNHKWPRASLLHCEITGPQGIVNLATVHLPSPRFGLQAVFDRYTIIRPSRNTLLVSETEHRRRTAKAVAEILDGLEGPLVVVGDFNMPVESTIYQEVWKDKYVNAFSLKGFGYGWSVFGGMRWFGTGVRVDHVLVRNNLGIAHCAVGPDVGSDHLPLFVEVAGDSL